ncbi:MAG: hypothetical protein ACSLEW_07400 [Nocardioides sp.]
MSKLHTLGWAVVLTALPVSLGLAVHTPAAPEPEAVIPVDLATVAVQRAPFCDAVDATEISAALGGSDPQTVATWEPGQVTQVTPDVDDVVNEFGCRWVGTKSAAAAWIYGPPVSPWTARRMSEVPQGCVPIDWQAFGAPSTAYLCGKRAVASGLFGDAWVTCAISGQGAKGRLKDWCRAAARAASG